MTRSPINDAIRRAAGRNLAAPARELELERPVADLGVGRGGAASAQPAPRSTSAEISDAIRVAAHRAQNRVDLDGVSLEDVLER
jgi:hypothetical protein